MTHMPQTNETLRPPLPKEPLPSDPDWTGWDSWRNWNEQANRELRERLIKRLTEAELAAEHWHEVSVLASNPTDPHCSTEAAATFRRFASAPHYYEVPDEDQ